MRVWEVAGELGVASATVWLLERGDLRVPYWWSCIEKLGRLYGAADETVAELSVRTRAVRGGSWLDVFRDVVPRDLASCLDVESCATRVRVYEGEAVPSLLQLGRYAEILGDRRIDGCDAAMWMRMRLQEARLDMMKERAADGVEFDFVIGECALVRPVGGPRLMADQLRNVSEVGEMRHVSVRVVPAGLHVRPELDVRAFEIVEMPDAASVVFGHQPSVGWQVKGPDRAVAYATAFEQVTSKAMDEEASCELIVELAHMFSRQARPGRTLALVPSGRSR